jgi:hypothetical protein
LIGDKLKPTLQDMCDEVGKMGDILACYVINKDGKLLGAHYGPIVMDEKLRQDFNQLAAGFWADLERVTTIGGEITLASIEYVNFKILGFPVRGSNAAILLTIEAKMNEKLVEERVKDFLDYWLKVNHYLDKDQLVKHSQDQYSKWGQEEPKND